MFQTGCAGPSGRGIENTPLVVDGILYVTGNNNQAWELMRARAVRFDLSPKAAAGDLDQGLLRPGQSRLRFWAMSCNMGTLDAHLVCAGKEEWRLIWDVAVAI